MCLVVSVLNAAAPLRLLDGDLHRAADLVRVHDDPAVRVSGRAADGLDQRSLRTQEPFLVRIEDRHQRNLRNIQPLPEQIDADQHVERAQPQIADDLHTLQRIDLRVQIAYFDIDAFEVVRQALRHLLGQRRDQHPFAFFGRLADLADQMVDLSLGRYDGDRRVQEPGRPDNLLRVHPAGYFLFVSGRGRTDKDRLIDQLTELIELQRPVVERRRQAEPVFHQRGFARTVAGVHRPELRQHGV